MKKTILFFISLVTISTIIVISCKKSEVIKETNLIQTKFNDFEKVTKLHSKTLSIVFEDLKAKKLLTKSNKVVFAPTEIDEITLNSLNKILVEDQLIKEFEKKYNISSQVLTKSGVEGTNEALYLMLEDSFTSVSQMSNVDSLRSEFISILSEPNLASTFTTDEQNLIFFSFACYIDSFEYWGENLDEWEEIIGNNMPMSPAEREMYRRSAQNRYAQADAMGGAVGVGGSFFAKLSPWSLLSSWIYSAVTSSVLTATN